MSKSARISPNASERARQARKRREVALFLPFIGALLFLTPLLDAFGFGEASVARKYLSIFSVWLILILISALISRTLRPDIEKS